MLHNYVWGCDPRSWLDFLWSEDIAPMDVENKSFHFHLCTSGRDRTIVHYQHKGCWRVEVSPSGIFDLLPFDESAWGFIKWRWVYLSGPGFSGFLFSCHKKLDQFRNGTHQVSHHLAGLVLVDKGTGTDAQWHGAVLIGYLVNILALTNIILCAVKFCSSFWTRTVGLISIR